MKMLTPNMSALDRAPAHKSNLLADVQQLVNEELQAVDRTIVKQLHSEVLLINQVGHYIIHSGGKRIRPLLLILSARAFDYDGTDHIDLAAIIEFIHTATLLHDDVVDGSNLRRGQESANSLWGNEASVLVGDFLYSRAFQMMVDVNSMRIMAIMADTTNVISEGEVMQLLNCQNPETTEADYRKVIYAKTAKLFEAAARLGAVLGRGSWAQEQAMTSYGCHLGTAFQLIDDVLDYSGSSEEIGKNIGDDLAEGKPTLPLIHAIRIGSQAQAAIMRKAIQKGGREHIEEVVSAVESSGAIAYTACAARAEAALALKALAPIPPSPHKEALQSLVEFSVDRSY
jgi:octaprenyl-diphosphate synthase